MNNFLKGLAALALALLLGVSAAYTSDSSSKLAVSELDKVTLTTHPGFDGPTLYRNAFEALRDYHITLADENERKEWSSEWENKFDKTDRLATQTGTDEAINTMIASLGQRFDHYETPGAKQQMREQIDSSLVGIGVQVTLKDIETDFMKRSSIDTLVVSQKHPLVVGSVVEGGPAQKAGLKEDDIIEAIDGQSLVGQKLTKVLSSIRGTRGSKVSLTIKRTGQPNLKIEILRDTVVNPVVHYKELGNGVAYVRLDHFLSKHAVSEMTVALERAARQKGLILDLRHNPGGDLEVAVAITTMLLPEGTIVELKSRDGNDIVTERMSVLKNLQVIEMSDAKNKQQAQLIKRPALIVPRKIPIVVLVNEFSASAAELVSGALQKNGRATIVGVTTVGKGVGQAIIELPFDRDMGVTSFEFLPNGESIDWVGVVPDIIAPSAQGVPFGDPRDEQLNSVAVQAIGDLIKKAEKSAQDEEQAEQTHKRNFESEKTQN